MQSKQRRRLNLLNQARKEKRSIRDVRTAQWVQRLAQRYWQPMIQMPQVSWTSFKIPQEEDQ